MTICETGEQFVSWVVQTTKNHKNIELCNDRLSLSTVLMLFIYSTLSIPSRINTPTTKFQVQKTFCSEKIKGKCILPHNLFFTITCILLYMFRTIYELNQDNYNEDD